MPVAKKETVTLSTEELEKLLERAAKSAVAEASMSKGVDEMDEDVPEQPLWARISKGPAKGLIKYLGTHGNDVDAILPERISDFFMRMQDKTVIPYTREDALFADKRNLVPCAANGGMYFYIQNGRTPHPIHGTEMLPNLLSRRALDNRVPISRATGRPANHKGITIVDRNGRPANFFASELPEGLPGMRKPAFGEPHEPKFNSWPTRFATEVKE